MLGCLSYGKWNKTKQKTWIGSPFPERLMGISLLGGPTWYVTRNMSDEGRISNIYLADPNEKSFLLFYSNPFMGR